MMTSAPIEGLAQGVRAPAGACRRRRARSMYRGFGGAMECGAVVLLGTCGHATPRKHADTAHELGCVDRANE